MDRLNMGGRRLELGGRGWPPLGQRGNATEHADDGDGYDGIDAANNHQHEHTVSPTSYA